MFALIALGLCLAFFFLGLVGGWYARGQAEPTWVAVDFGLQDIDAAILERAEMISVGFPEGSMRRAGDELDD